MTRLKAIDNYDRWSLKLRSHWSPTYIKNRISEYLFRKRHPDLPWLTPQAIDILGTLIDSKDRVLEFGSGRSSLWLAKRCQSLVSFEDNKEWYDLMRERFISEGFNIDYRLIESSTEAYFDAFANSVGQIENNSIDICLVDGGPRGLCALRSIPKIKSGGILIVDNVNWFLPSNTESPSSVRTERDIAPEFKEVHEIIRSWRYVWTSNGVTDTAFYFKP